MRVVAQLILFVTWVAFVWLLIAANIRRTPPRTPTSEFEKARWKQ